MNNAGQAGPGLTVFSQKQRRVDRKGTAGTKTKGAELPSGHQRTWQAWESTVKEALGGPEHHTLLHGINSKAQNRKIF